MQNYRYDGKIIVKAYSFNEARRLIEQRISGPLNCFRLEIMVNGKYENFQ